MVNIILYGSIALVDLGLLIVVVSRSHSETPHSVGCLWMTDRPGPEPYTWQHTTLTRGRYPYPWRDSNPQSR